MPSNYTPLDVKEKSTLKKHLLITLLSGIGGALVYPVSILYGKIVTSLFSDIFTGIPGLLLAFVVGYLIGVGAIVTTVLIIALILRILRFKDLFWLSLIAFIFLAGSPELIKSFSDSTIQAVFAWVLMYMIIYNILHALFLNLQRFRRPLIIALIILSLGAFYTLPRVGVSRLNKQSYEKQKKKLSQINFQLYAPENIKTGRFEYNVHSYGESLLGPPYVRLHFNLGLKANVYKTPSYFNPPTNCGQTTPQDTMFGNFECRQEAITPKGRVIWAYAQHLDTHPNAQAEYYYVKINNTVISFEWFPRDFKKEEIVELVDSLRPVTIEELKAFSNLGQQEEKEKTKNPVAFVKFKTYMPSYLPFKYRIKKILLGNPKDPSNPDLLFILGSGAHMYQFKSKRDFNPPENCGLESAEEESQYERGYECSLLVSTPKGIKVYSYFNPVPSKAYFFIGETKFSLSWIEDLNTLIKIVDSLEEKPINKINYEAYK